MNYLQAVILSGLERMGGERTVYAVYHLLTGKKSSQTIQDAHLYRLTRLFKLYPRLSRTKFTEQIKLLSDEYTYLSYDQQCQKYRLTERGKQQLQSFFNDSPFPTYIHGWKYQDNAILFWKRLTLLTQVTSNLLYEENRYYPVQRDLALLEWIKQFLRKYVVDRHHLAMNLYDEFIDMFSDEFPEDPLMIVLRLSGYNRVGLTAEQTALQLGMEQTEFDLRFTNGLHYMIQTMIGNKRQYPILASLFIDSYQPVPYTQSTLATYNLLKNNYSIEEIAQIRNLKVSTIEDHIIEIALMDDDFIISRFISEGVVDEVLHTVKQLGGKKLKPIKERVPHASYFQIRLVLAREGRKCEQV